MPAPSYRESAYVPNAELPLVTLAARITRECGDVVPTARQLESRYGMSRATAFRWHNALRDALPFRQLAAMGCSRSEIELAIKEAAHA